MSCRSPGCGIVAAPSPSSRSSSRLVASPALLVDVLPALPSHRLRPVIISCRRLVIHFPRLAACLARRLCPIRHLSCHLGQFCLRPASRLASRSVLPWDVIAVLPDRSPCRSACSHRSPRPACRLAGSGAGRVAFLAIACPPCRRCLLWMASRLRAFPRCGLLCLLWCRRLCLYCDGEIIYMICPVVII